MAQPTNSTVHVDSALTNISVAFMQKAENFVAGRVFPNIPVSKQSDQYFLYDRGDFNRDQAEVRAPGTESAGGSYDIDNTPNYFAKVWSIHKDVPDQIIANADAALSPEREAAEWVTHQMLIRRERQWATNYFAGSVWTNDFDGVASSPSATETIQWSDTTSGDPIGDLRGAKTTVLESTGFEPNTLVIGQQVFDALVDHPDIVDRVKYSGGVGNGNPANVSEQTLAQLFGLDRVMISKAIVNTAGQGLTNVHSFIAGKKALLCYAAPNPGLMTPSAGYTFSWSGYLGMDNTFGFATKRFYIDALSSTRVEGEMAFDQKVVSADLGYFWDTIVA